MQVLIQLRSSARTRTALTRAKPTTSLASSIERAAPGVRLDPEFEPVSLPTPQPPEPGANPYDLAQPLRFAFQPEAVTHVVRGTMPDANLSDAIASLTTSNPDVISVFSDPVIESCICPQRSIGTYKDVARVFNVSWLHSKRMDGRGVRLAIVDTGINKEQLVKRGQAPLFDSRRSWAPPGVAKAAGKYGVDHGTMCAFDAGIAAPKARLLDYALLLSRTSGPTVMSGFLSDAVRGYGKLLRMIRNTPVSRRRLVVSNSWGMFSPSWDFPVGHPGNYSDNPAHPFNVIVASLEAEGADILFAAGNCGRECPDGRCEFSAAQRPICGANSHPKVLCVAGIDYRKRRIGYSSQGPGRLEAQKPDISAATAFIGSRVFPGGDGGTSAACPVAAGVIAAVRSRYPSARISPADLRSLVTSTADDLGGTGYDPDYGWGAIHPRKLAEAVAAAT